MPHQGRENEMSQHFCACRRSIVSAVVVVTILAFTPLAQQSAQAAIVINEVYSGGGSSNALAAYQTDFIELFNNGIEPVNLSGYKLEYAPASRANGVFDVPVGMLSEGA